MSRKVYLFRAAQFFKIGISGNISKRLTSVQTGCPIKCDYVGYFPAVDPEQLERELHIRFNEVKTYGEWFDLGDDNIRLMITEFNLKHVINPYVNSDKINEAASASPQLKRAREVTADINEICRLYESYYPGHTPSNYGKTIFRKMLKRYGSEAVVESIDHLSARFDGDKMFTLLPHSARNYATYKRHIKEETWKAYYAIKTELNPEAAREFLTFVMRENIDTVPGLALELKDTILAEYDEYSIQSIMESFLNEVLSKP